MNAPITLDPILAVVLLLSAFCLGYAVYALRLRWGTIPTFILRSLFADAPNHIITTDTQMRCTYVNPFGERIFQRPAQGAIGRRPQDFDPPETFQALEKPLQMALRGETFQEPVTPTRFEGKIVSWRQINFWPIRTTRGKISGVMMYVQQMEETHRLTEQVEYQSRLLNAVQDVVIASDKNLQITYWNRGAETLYGYTVAEALGRNPGELLRTKMSAEEMVDRVAALDSKTVLHVHLTNYTKAGDTVIVDAITSSIYDADRQITGYLSVHRDVTGRLRFETALRASEQRYRSLFENATEGIYCTDSMGRFSDVNPAFIRMLGYASADEVRALRIPEELYVNPEDRRQLSRGFVAQGKLRDMVLNWKKKNGQHITIQLNGIAIHDQEGKPVAYECRVTDITERKRTEEALQRSENSFKQLFATNPLPMWVFDRETLEFLDVNDAAIARYGYSREEFLQMRVTEIRPKEDVAKFLDELSKRYLPVQFDDQLRHLLKDGRIIDVEIASHMLVFNGREAMLIVAQDVTERNQIARELRASEARFRAVIENASDMISIMDQDGKITYISPSITHVLGYDPAEVIGHNSLEYVHADDVDALAARFRNEAGVSAPATALTVRMYHKDGSLRAVEFARNVAFDVPGINGVVINARDVTARRMYEEALQQLTLELEERVHQRTVEIERQTAQLSAVLGAMGEGVYYSENNRIRYINHALADLTGYSPDELIDQSTNIFLASEGDTLPPLIEMPPPGTAWRGEIEMRCKDGTSFTAALTVTMVVQMDNIMRGAVTVVRNITEERQLQAQKSRFLANASHELRTPLTNFKTRLYLLRKQPERLDDHLTVLEQVTDRMISLIEDLLDVSRFERGIILLRRREVVLQELIDEVLVLQQHDANRKHIVITADLPHYPFKIYVDPNRIIQVLVNLIVNAINYTPDGGRVLVALEGGEHQEAIVRVSDTGIGIRPEDYSRIFEPFFRVGESATPGTGLGLSITKEIVMLHHGQIDLESQVGQGSTFTVRLPLSPIQEADKTT